MKLYFLHFLQLDLTQYYCLKETFNNFSICLKNLFKQFTKNRNGTVISSASRFQQLHNYIYTV